MADYGIEIKNNSYDVQIDSKYRNLSLDKSRNNAYVINNNNGFYTRTSIPASSLPPLMLIRPASTYYVAISYYHKDFFDKFSGVNISTNYNQSIYIDWRCCRENRTPSSEIYGVRVYNSTGNLCFDSGKKYFKIHSVHPGINLNTPANSSPDGDYIDISHSSISNPFYILSPGAMYVYQGVAPLQTYANKFMIGLKQISSTSVRVGWFTDLWRNYGFNLSYILSGSNPTQTLIVCEDI